MGYIVSKVKSIAKIFIWSRDKKYENKNRRNKITRITQIIVKCETFRCFFSIKEYYPAIKAVFFFKEGIL